MSKRGAEDTTAPGNNGLPSKRSRVSRACDQCRIAREKCDGKTPCSSCALSQRACSYTANPKKRGIQPGYIRTLELALTWLFNHSDAESVLNRELSEKGTASVLLQRDSKESNRLHKSWRKSKFCRDVNALLSRGENLEGSARSPSPDSDDQESNAGTSLHLESTALDHTRQTPLTTHPTQGDIAAFHIPEQQGRHQTHYRDRCSEASSDHHGQTISLPSNFWRLFDIYFSYTHSWFPICEKFRVLKLSHSYPEVGLRLRPNMLDSGDHAELWGILALASLQEHCHGANTFGGSASNAKRAYDIAQSLVSDPTSSQIGHARTLLLLSLFHVTRSEPDVAWMSLGRASRIAIALAQQPSQVSKLEHVTSGCVLLDHLVSMQIGRAPYLQLSDIERVGRVEEEGLEEYQPWSGCMKPQHVNSLPRAPALSLSTYNCLVDLVGVMSIIASSTIPASESAAKLDAWKSRLPVQQRQVLSDHLPIAAAPPALLLRTVYCCACIVTLPCRTWVERFLEVLEHIIKQFGRIAMPPIVHCLMGILKRSTAFLADEGLNARLRNLHLGYDFAKSQESNKEGTEDHHNSSLVAIAASGPSQLNSAMELATPESMQPQLHPSHQFGGRVSMTPTVMDARVPHVEPTAHYSQSHFDPHQSSQRFIGPQVNNPVNRTVMDPLSPGVGHDMESFFDELTSLDGAKSLETRRRFMENLGFAPDANLNDVLAKDFG